MRIASEVYYYLKKNPGRTSYEIAKELGCSVKKIQSALHSRLNLNADIEYEDIVEEGRMIRKYYAK